MFSSHDKSVHYKVFLKNDDGSNIEIQRFDSSELHYLVYESLCEKLKSIFPGTRDKNFTVSWIDEENDEIKITSTAGLSIALEIASKKYSKYTETSLLNRPSIKLHVKLNQKDKNAQCFQKEAIIHGNVICDGCDNVISGFRYKCMTCEDYDLCSQCETLGLHADHCMLRMLQPLNWSTHSGKRVLDHIKKFLRRKGLDYCNRELSGHETRKEKQPEGNVAATSENIVEESPKRNTKLIDLTIIEPPLLSDSTYVSHNSTTSVVNPLIEGWTILDKNGISRASSVSSNLDESSENNLATVSGTTTATTSAATSAGIPTTTPMSTSMYTLDITSATKSAPTSVFRSVIAPITTPVITPVTTPVITPVITSATTSATTSISTSTTTSVSTSATTSVSTSATTSVSTSATTPESTSATTSATAPMENSPLSIHPQLQKESRIHHPNPIIHNALLALITMGYSNNGGVLTHLLETEDGDINRVIDILEYGKR